MVSKDLVGTIIQLWDSAIKPDERAEDLLGAIRAAAKETK